MQRFTGRQLTRIVLAACMAMVIAACADWMFWNAVFTRDSVAGSRGWTGGDGGLSVPLPNSDDTLWIFGDSFVTDWDLDLNQRLFRPFPLADIVFGNVVAVQKGSSRPDPSKITFFARLAGDGPVDDVTSETIGRREMFFSRRMLGLPPPEGQTLIWPQGAECLHCDEDDASVALSFKEVENCDPSTGPPDCIPLCEVTGSDSGSSEECMFGVRVVTQILAQVHNPRDALENWQASAIGTRPADVSWGADFVEKKDFVIIYGARERDGVTDAVVAVSRPDDLLDMDAWWVYTNLGWKRGEHLGEIAGGEEIVPAVIAEDVGALFTVDEIRRRGKTRYLLGHAHPTGDNLVFVRLSRNPFRWPRLHEKTPRIDLRAFDPTLDRVAQDWIDRGVCESVAENGVADESRCGITYHAQIHRHLSDWDAFGPATLLYSYIVPLGPADRNNSADYYRPRFGNIPLDRIEPWCKSSRSACWQGLNHLYENQQIEDGEVRTYRFDVSAAKKITLDLKPGSGRLDLTVSFGETPGERSLPCHRYRRGPRRSSTQCGIRVPRGKTTAWVKLSASTSARFDLQVSYDSWQGIDESAQILAGHAPSKSIRKVRAVHHRAKLHRGLRALAITHLEMSKASIRH